MLPSRGLLRASPSLGLARAALHKSAARSASSSSRQFGTALRNTNSAAAFNGRRIGGPVAITAVTLSQQLFSSARQARYASTQPAAAAAAAAPSATAAPSAAAVPDVGADLASSSTDLSSLVDLSGSDLLNMPEQIGFLKALGLDYGWGPTAVMEYALEHIYIYTGLPWWASIAVLAVGLRIAIFKPSLDATVQSQKLQDLRKNPRYEAATEAVKEAAMKTKDQFAMMAARTELRNMNRAAGFKMWKTLIPMINIPIGYGMFRLMKGMAALPVPSLESGGFLWFPDLTVADPYFVLPIVTAVFVALGFKQSIPYMAPAQQKTMRIMGMVMLPLSLLFTAYIPSGAQLYFLIAGVGHTLQLFLFYSPWFRKLVGLGPLSAATTASAPTPNNTWQAPRVINTTARVADNEPAKAQSNIITSTMGPVVDAAKEKLANYNNRGQKEKTFKAAQEYEAKRALEEKEKMAARREMKQVRKRRNP
ncbi:60Kd inner membrane protein-domain-containing protein [Podospora appendiculata]|uniref:60Kd inner membrane protein-domain-containing protein n=1 Tax=Podospora appendiculata TaxID=314037 RepID=A0AAE0X5F0_9PEZI|nr:60Kd inner membrane protein-domain-containing protein [Podospora appendiculata]